MIGPAWAGMEAARTTNTTKLATCQIPTARVDRMFTRGFTVRCMLNFFLSVMNTKSGSAGTDPFHGDGRWPNPKNDNFQMRKRRAGFQKSAASGVACLGNRSVLLFFPRRKKGVRDSREKIAKTQGICAESVWSETDKTGAICSSHLERIAPVT
jgi:hypothetical protein